MVYKIFSNKNESAQNLAKELVELISSFKKDKITIAISGGTTPFVMFDVWAREYAGKIDWQKLHFFWVDERCVNPTSEESNYRNTKEVLFDKINIPLENIHRVKGENDPMLEAESYALEIEKYIETVDGTPQFDIILLGMGDDGHTASIFPPQIDLLKSDKTVSVAQNPYNKQNRITLTGKVINNAAHIYFLVTGTSKAEIVKRIFTKEGDYEKYPASHIKCNNGKLVWIFDNEAAALLG